MKNNNSFILVFLFLFMGLCPSLANPTDVGDWKILGITTVKGGLDRDEVKVTAAKGMFTRVKIKVKQAPLEMKRCVVHFGNGQTQEIKTRKNFGKNTETIPHTLKGGKRFIKKVVFWYAQRKWSGPKPVVVLLGSNSSPDVVLPPIGGGGNGDWKVLGIKDVSGGLDRDEMRITARKGLFRQVKVKVRNAPIEMGKFIIHFENGQTQEIPVRKQFKKNTETIPHTLKQGKRFIKKAVFWYSKKNWAGPKPIVVLLGRE